MPFFREAGWGDRLEIGVKSWNWDKIEMEVMNGCPSGGTPWLPIGYLHIIPLCSYMLGFDLYDIDETSFENKVSYQSRMHLGKQAG